MMAQVRRGIMQTDGILWLAMLWLAGCNSAQVASGKLCADSAEPGVVEGSVTLRTPEDVRDLAGCETVLGSLTIDGDDGLKHLDGLEDLKRVEGSLLIGRHEKYECVSRYGSVEPDPNPKISNPSLSNLNGLRGLKSIGGDLIVDGAECLAGNEALASLAGLSGLEKVGGNIEIANNPLLRDLTGLNKVSSVQDLYIEGNATLSNLKGLEGIRTVHGNIFIGHHRIHPYTGRYRIHSYGYCLLSWDDTGHTGNESLESLSGLESLSTLKGGLFVGGDCEPGNPKLRSIAALSKLESMDSLLIWSPNVASLEGLHHVTIAGEVTIHADALTSLEGLRSLQTVQDSVYLEGNANLSSLEGLNALVRVGGSLRIGHVDTEWDWEAEHYSPGGNPLLKNLQGLNKLSEVGGQLDIADNDSLTTVDGLDALVSVGAQQPNDEPDLNIESNPMLASLEGLSRLTTVGGDLTVKDNAQLETLGLHSVTRVDGEVEVRDNPALPDAEAQTLATRAGKTCTCSRNGT